MNLILIYFVLPVLSLTMVLVFLRVIRGPRLMDRVVALDMLAIVGIGFTAAFAILFDKKVIIDVALILALVAFISTIAFAYYYQKEGED